jgi:CheY-like chemotaxis protein
MGGKVGFESTEGVGSNFYLDIPLKYAESQNPKVSLEASKVDMKPLRILIADDLEDNRLLLKLYLEDRIEHADFAKNGREALELWKNNSYDVVLLDMHMPELNGSDVIRAIRKEESETGKSPTLIFALSAESQEKEKSDGSDVYLEKPFTRKQLRDALEQLLRPNARL